MVVGDQSSGKSSLLEGLTGLSFPVATDICTRFATQLILRRSASAESTAIVSIIPGPSSSGNEKARKHLESFRQIVVTESLESVDLSQILSDASEHLGLPSIGAKLDENNIPSRRFSDDIVVIELSARNHHHLSVVDVPGLFHNPTRFQTAEDKEIIRNLIKEYVSQERTIILAVCDATSNLANQEVFELAREADSYGQRTVGIITKCDIVPEGDEESVMQIAANRYEKLNHGWFVVKNRSKRDIDNKVSIAMRHHNERSFLDITRPWSMLEKTRRGVGPLKEYLGSLLSDYIRQEFPSLVSELKSLHEQSVVELKQMGEPRQTPAEQRMFLVDIASRYEKYVTGALFGNYDPPIRDDEQLLLRRNIRSREDDFGDKMRFDGHKFVFRTVQDDEDREFRKHASKPIQIQDGVQHKKKKAKKSAIAFEIPSVDGRDQIEDLESFGPVEEVCKTENTIYEWIRGIYLNNRGIELPGMVNPVILRISFQEQSEAWESIATAFFEDAVEILRNFNEAILKVLVPDTNIQQNIGKHLQGYVEESINHSREHLKALTSSERDGILKTQNDYFSETLQKCRDDRVAWRLRNIGINESNFSGNFDLKSIMTAASIKSEDQAVNDIHDALKAYYKVSLKRFVDQVIKGPIEDDLFGESGPVRIFSPRFVSLLTDEQLANIAAETSLALTTRAEARVKSERLRSAMHLAGGISI